MFQKTANKFIRSRRNWCEYCKEYQTKISRHLVLKHTNESDVAAYLKIKDQDLKEKKKKRRDFCKQIISKFNKIHNDRILNKESTGSSGLIPMKNR